MPHATCYMLYDDRYIIYIVYLKHVAMMNKKRFYIPFVCLSIYISVEIYSVHFQVHYKANLD